MARDRVWQRVRKTEKDAITKQYDYSRYTAREHLRAENMQRYGLTYQDIANVLHRSYMSVYRHMNKAQVMANRLIREKRKTMKVKIKKLSENAVMPKKAHASDAGFDLYASEEAIIPSNSRALIPTDIAMAIPDGYYGMVVGRSGNTIKRGLVGMTGIVDAGYRNGIGIMAFNLTNDDITIEKGERAGQIILTPILRCNLKEVDELNDTDRGDGGYGSTGK